jgi:hypothetical protein
MTKYCWGIFLSLLGIVGIYFGMYLMLFCGLVQFIDICKSDTVYSTRLIVCVFRVMFGLPVTYMFGVMPIMCGIACFLYNPHSLYHKRHI